MKTTVLAMILACALSAAADDAAQSQSQPSAGGGQQAAAPEIKDPNEYNAYVAAIQQKDPAAKTSALEAFLTQYPNSVMKTTAFEVLMGTYLQAGNQPKVTETAKRLLTADSCNIRALAILTSLGRQAVQAGQTAQLADLTQYSSKGLECVKSAPKPATVASESDWDTLKKQVTPIFEGGAGFACLQNKDFACAATHLRAAVEAEPNQDPLDVYYLGFALLSSNPPDNVNGLYFIARASSLASGGGADQIKEYGRKKYKNFHGSEDGWNAVLFTAKSNPLPPSGFAITQYVPPTPAQQAHDIVNGKTPDQIQQISFGEWELVLSAGSQEDQDKVWNVIKNRPLQMEGTVISATKDQLQIAASEDDIEKKQADITLTMTGEFTARNMPKAGDTLDFEGTPTDYTSAVHAGSAPAAGQPSTGDASAAPASPDANAANAPGTPGAAAAPGMPAQGTTPATGAAPAPGAAPATGAPATPFMMTMEKGKLLQKAGTPAKKPAARRPAARRPQH